MTVTADLEAKLGSLRDYCLFLSLTLVGRVKARPKKRENWTVSNQWHRPS
jgi:hypothetical protein